MPNRLKINLITVIIAIVTQIRIPGNRKIPLITKPRQEPKAESMFPFPRALNSSGAIEDTVRDMNGEKHALWTDIGNASLIVVKRTALRALNLF